MVSAPYQPRAMADPEFSQAVHISRGSTLAFELSELSTKLNVDQVKQFIVTINIPQYLAFQQRGSEYLKYFQV